MFQRKRRTAFIGELEDCTNQTVYRKVARGEIPPPDGKDPHFFWWDETLKNFYATRQSKSSGSDVVAA